MEKQERGFTETWGNWGEDVLRMYLGTEIC